MSGHDKRFLLPHVQAFFTEYLTGHRGLSPNTVKAYRDALKLFFSFTCVYSKRAAARLMLDDLKVDTVLAFLADIEASRGNCAVTRNLRLAAIKALATYLIGQDPTCAANISASPRSPANGRRAP
jgi:integrase/recombinase XerD